MKTASLFALTTLAALPAVAETRQMDAHVHGVGSLNIAIEGFQIAMELHAPGADIVGFEHAAESDADKAAIEAAIATLNKPFEVFSIPEAAGCVVLSAKAELEMEGDHDGHDHGDHDDHGHDDHGHNDHDDHGHDDHKDHDHDAHKHDDHDHGHDDHAHDKDAKSGSHSEFHAEYLLTCEDASDVTSMTLAYFDLFPNALELEVQVLTDSGSTALEATRDAPTLDLSDVI